MDEGSYELTFEVVFIVDDYPYMTNLTGDMDFEIDVQTGGASGGEPSGGGEPTDGGGIPGFPLLGLLTGIIGVALLKRRFLAGPIP